MVALLHLLVALATLTSIAYATSNDLPKCEFDTEIQFYNAEIDILDLPEACYDDNNLMTIGFIIQDVVWDVEDRLPRFKEETSRTKVCPFPEEVEERRNRRLLSKTLYAGKEKQSRKLAPAPAPTPNMITRRYRFQSTGRCRRCKNKTTARQLQSRSEVCSFVKQAMLYQEQAEDTLKECIAILAKFDAMARVLDDKDADKLLEKAQDKVDKCKEENDEATRVEKDAARFCESAAGASQGTLKDLVKDAEHIQWMMPRTQQRRQPSL